MEHLESNRLDRRRQDNTIILKYCYEEIIAFLIANIVAAGLRNHSYCTVKRNAGGRVSAKLLTLRSIVPPPAAAR